MKDCISLNCWLFNQLLDYGNPVFSEPCSVPCLSTCLLLFPTLPLPSLPALATILAVLATRTDPNRRRGISSRLALTLVPERQPA